MRNLFLRNFIFVPIHIFEELVWLCLSPEWVLPYGF